MAKQPHPAPDSTCGRDQAHTRIYLSLTQVDGVLPTAESVLKYANPSYKKENALGDGNGALLSSLQ